MEGNELREAGISFIIPALNEEALILACLSSIRREIYMTNLSGASAQIIVVDNGSRDRTREIVKEMAEISPFIWLCHEPVKGVVRARQRGLLCAQYDLVANIDADNELPPGWLAAALAAIAEPGVVAASGPFHFADQALWMRVATRLFYGLGAIAHRFIGPMLQGGNYIVRREALMRAGGYDLSYEFFGEDTVTARRMASVGKVVLVPGMWVYASSRRMTGQGRVLTTARYIMNYLWVTWFDRPFTKAYTDVREQRS